MRGALDGDVLAVLARQDNVIGNWQVDERTRRLLQRTCARGEGRRLTWSVYLLSPAPPTPAQLVWAAYLHCGPASMIAGRSALVLAGWGDAHRRPIHALVPGGRQPTGTPAWLRVHRSQSIPEQSLGSPPRVPPHLAAVQAAAWAASDREAMFVLTSSMQQGIITPIRFQREVASTSRVRRRTLMLDTAGEYLSGTQSTPEFDFGRLCRHYGIPAPIRQTRRRDASGRWRYTDAEFVLPDGRTLIVEIDGLHHLDPANWLADIRRQNDLMVTTNGLVLRVATWTLKHEPAEFMPFLGRLLTGNV